MNQNFKNKFEYLSLTPKMQINYVLNVTFIENVLKVMYKSQSILFNHDMLFDTLAPYIEQVLKIIDSYINDPDYPKLILDELKEKVGNILNLDILLHTKRFDNLKNKIVSHTCFIYAKPKNIIPEYKVVLALAYAVRESFYNKDRIEASFDDSQDSNIVMLDYPNIETLSDNPKFNITPNFISTMLAGLDNNAYLNQTFIMYKLYKSIETLLDDIDKCISNPKHPYSINDHFINNGKLDVQNFINTLIPYKLSKQLIDEMREIGIIDFHIRNFKNNFCEAIVDAFNNGTKN